jgi:hypothetical protein
LPLPKFSAAKATKENDSAFVTRISVDADKLVGRYSWTEHQAGLSQIHNDRLNRVIEVKYPPWLMLEAPTAVGSRKRKAAAETEAALLKNTAPKRRKQISWSSEKTSVVEKALVKPLKSLKRSLF